VNDAKQTNTRIGRIKTYISFITTPAGVEVTANIIAVNRRGTETDKVLPGPMPGVIYQHRLLPKSVVICVGQNPALIRWILWMSV